ncbi:MAG TPA: hypothetical protein VFU22_22670 [Roseiflexaceae bacterium]|nr:hypothetical protein [Roseiflexaceae bacterium]
MSTLKAKHTSGGKRKRATSAPPRLGDAQHKNPGTSTLSRRHSQEDTTAPNRPAVVTAAARPRIDRASNGSRERPTQPTQAAASVVSVVPTIQRASPTPETLLRDMLGDHTIFDDEPVLSLDKIIPDTFIRITESGVQVSGNFRAALQHMANIDPTGQICNDLRIILAKMQRRKGLTAQEADVLQTFIDYQVFRQGEHLRTKDEDDWTEKITQKVLEEHPDLPRQLFETLLELDAIAELVLAEMRKNQQAFSATTEDMMLGIDAVLQAPTTKLSPELRGKGLSEEVILKVLRKRLKDMIQPLIAQNYMCRCRYSEPAPTLLRRDTPQFVLRRLRVQERTNVAVHIFQAKNGYSIAYDPRLLKLDPTKTYTVEQLAGVSPTIREFLASYKPPDSSQKGRTFELATFDSAHFMLADVQVPVMDDAVEIALPRAGKQPFRVKIGQRPEEVGLKMTHEPAGVFKRSLNSQRVIEIADWDDQGNKVVLQLKGAGVPAYGFMRDQDWSGGEYLALTIEKGAMLLRNFTRDVFQIDDVVPVMVGVALAAGSDVATNEEAAGRFGAVSFRIDPAMGVRLSNLLYETVAAQISRRLQVIPTADWEQQIVRTLARNMALVNLFGLQYNDSGVQKLVDVGLHGEFADTGGLWNLNRPPKLAEMALLQGIKLHIGADSVRLFEERYPLELLNALDQITGRLPGPMARELRELIAQLNVYKQHETRLKTITPAWRSKALIERLREIQLSLLASFVATMGGTDKSPTPCQRAYEAQGIEGFARVLIENMNNVTVWMRAIIVDKVIAAQLEDVIQALDIHNENELRKIMGLGADDPWPPTNTGYSFEDRLDAIKTGAKWAK